MSEDEIKLRGSLSPEDMVRFQINRCNITASYPDRSMYDENVLTLMRNLPSHKLFELQNQKDEYTIRTTVYQYKYACGHRMGSPPTFDEDGLPKHDKDGLIIGSVYRNKPEQWNYNPNENDGKPVLVSPIPMKTDIIDYDKLFELVMEKLEEAGISWKIDKIEVDGGLIRETKKTPTFRSDYFIITSRSGKDEQ